MCNDVVVTYLLPRTFYLILYFKQRKNVSMNYQRHVAFLHTWPRLQFGGPNRFANERCRVQNGGHYD